MSKKISKFLLTLLLITMVTFSFSTCFAEVDGEVTKSVTDGSAVTTSDTPEETTAEQEIHNGDLYLFDTNIVMDKLVDGNVFIFGNNVEIKGQVNGNLFVCANTLKFNECYVRYSVFACANSIYYNGACNDLYAACNNLEMTYDSYVVRDVKATCADAIFRAAVGRDVDLACNKVNFGEVESAPIIYGNLRYTANSEATIPEGVITDNGSVTYTRINSTKNISETITDIIIGFLTCIATVLVIYALTKNFTPNFFEKLSNKELSILNLLKALGIGLLTTIVVIITSIILLITTIGAKLSLILITLFIVLCFVAVPALTIAITNALKPAFKIEKTSMFCLILALVSIILYGITLIPVVGGILGFIIKMIAIGLLIDMMLPHKELSEDEVKAIAEAKKQAKANKEKRKQENLEAKNAKKADKKENK